MIFIYTESKFPVRFDKNMDVLPSARHAGLDAITIDTHHVLGRYRSIPQ